MKGKGVYKGRHWTQQPENKEKLAAMARKVGKVKRGTFRTIAKAAVKSKRGPYKSTKKEAKPFVIRTHGYRIVLDKDEIRIENE